MYLSIGKLSNLSKYVLIANLTPFLQAHALQWYVFFINGLISRDEKNMLSTKYAFAGINVFEIVTQLFF